MENHRRCFAKSDGAPAFRRLLSFQADPLRHSRLGAVVFEGPAWDQLDRIRCDERFVRTGGTRKHPGRRGNF